MKAIIYNFALIISVTYFSFADGKEVLLSQESCQAPSEYARGVIDKFLRDSEEFIESDAKEELINSSARAMRDEIHRGMCGELLKNATDKLLMIREEGDAKGTYVWDVSFFKIDSYYAVVYIETPKTKDRKNLSSLDKAWPGRLEMVELYNSDFERLGLYDERGYSYRDDNKVILRKEDRELRE